MASKMLRLMLVLSTVAVTSILGQRNIGLTGPQFRDLQLGQNSDLLEFAARTGDSVLVIVDGPEVLAVVQEGVNLNMNCLPWLQRFPGAMLRWLFQGFDPFFMMPTGAESEIQPGVDPRRMVGGEFNHWLNVTRTLLVPGAEDADTGQYACEACYIISTNPLVMECHRANITLQVIGGPPFIDDADSPNEAPRQEPGGTLVYRIGANLCVPPDMGVRIEITCDIPNSDEVTARMLNISQAFPIADRAWYHNTDLLYSLSLTEVANIATHVSMDFFLSTPERMLLMPGALTPSALTASEGGLIFDTSVNNASQIETLMGEQFEQARRNLRTQLLRAVVGTWRCEANNSFGSDSASSTIRLCGGAPNLPGCPEGANQVIFPDPGTVVVAGCTVCIPRGSVITLDCSGASATAVSYEWRDANNQLVSSMARFTTTIEGMYTCNATNVDNPTETAVTVLAYSNAISYTSQITEQSVSQPRQDNGCSRLRDQSGLGNVGACVFVGETLDLACATADTGNPLEITAPNGAVGNGTLRVMDVGPNDGGIYRCQLTAVSGPCGNATLEMNVTVFDPARIDRTSNFLGCTHFAGRQRGNIFQPGNTAVVLCCPFDGIETPNTSWYSVSVDDRGCAREDLIQDGGNFTLSNPATDVLALSFTFLGGGSTYVCRTSNNAGADADTVSLQSNMGVEWMTSDYSACNLRCRDGVRTRAVVCRSSVDGMILPDTECEDAGLVRPNNTQSCANDYPAECLLDPVWISGDWTQCYGGGCGGWRFRSVQCQVPMTGEVRADYACRGYPKPQDYDFEGCRRECCIEDRSPTYCRANGAGYCSDEAFSKECCWTCGRKTIGG